MLPGVFPARLCFIAALALLGGDVAAGAADKSAFNLFNPVPEAAMRELEPDRPSKTENPFTVDAGHFQLEMDFANYALDDSRGVHTSTWNLAPIDIKAGVLKNADVEFIFDSYLNVRSMPRRGPTAVQSGVGDFTTRLKVNLWGDDGGGTSFALLPFVKFPTNTDHLGNDAVEGGVLLPLDAKLPAGFDASFETGAEFLRDAEGAGYHADFIDSVSLDRRIAGKLSGYAEFFSDVSTEARSGLMLTVDGGLEYLVDKNIQLDCGCNFGVTRAAEAFNPFAGLTVRF